MRALQRAEVRSEVNTSRWEPCRGQVTGQHRPVRALQRSDQVRSKMNTGELRSQVNMDITRIVRYNNSKTHELPAN